MSEIGRDEISAFKRLGEYAREYHDGHYSLYRFTTNWILILGSQDTVTHEDLRNMKGYRTLSEAVENAIANDEMKVKKFQWYIPGRRGKE